MEHLQEYNISGQSYYENQYLKPDPKCNGWIAINRGDGVVFINGIPLSPSTTPGTAGESFSVGGNEGEIWGGDLHIQFATGATVQDLVLVQKFYLKKVPA